MKYDELVNKLLQSNAPMGMDTYWHDGNVKVTIKDVIKHLDSIKDYESGSKERVQKADLKYPLIVTVSKGKYKSILDGNHRAFKALANNIDTIKVREVDLDAKDTPQVYKNLFDYSIEPLQEGFVAGIYGDELPPDAVNRMKGGGLGAIGKMVATP